MSHQRLKIAGAEPDPNEATPATADSKPSQNHDPNKDVIGDGKSAGVMPFEDTAPAATDNPNEATPESATENTQRQRPDPNPPGGRETYAGSLRDTQGYQRLSITDPEG